MVGAKNILGRQRGFMGKGIEGGGTEGRPPKDVQQAPILLTLKP